MTEEVWKDIPGYEGLYQASTLGRIRSVSRRVKSKSARTGLPTTCFYKGQIKAQRDAAYYKKINLSKDHKYKTFHVHVLIMLTFIGERPDNKVIDHIDGNKHNNELSNLAYVSHVDNNWNGTYWNGKRRSYGPRS